MGIRMKEQMLERKKLQREEERERTKKDLEKTNHPLPVSSPKKVGYNPKDQEKDKEERLKKEKSDKKKREKEERKRQEREEREKLEREKENIRMKMVFTSGRKKKTG